MSKNNSFSQKIDNCSNTECSSSVTRLPIPDLQKEIDTLKNECTNVQKFLDVVKKYVCVQELTPEVLRTFISKIVVHEREKKHSQTSPQQIDIYFRYIGTVALPSEINQPEEKTHDERRTA